MDGVDVEGGGMRGVACGGWHATDDARVEGDGIQQTIAIEACGRWIMLPMF